jgi:tetratricopeptide (TPR) repeat protein
MMFGITLILAFFQLGGSSQAGRRGNDLYEQDELPRAAAAYREGITRQEGNPSSSLNSGLWNNLGATLHRMGAFDEAAQAFDQSMAIAPSATEAGRAAYNAGNNVFASVNAASSAGGVPGGGTPDEGGGPSLESAVEYYRQALLNDPTNEDAKFNYEFVKRRLEQQRQEQQQQQQQQPNEDEPQDQDQQNQNQDQEGNQENQGQQEQDPSQQGDQQNEGQQDQQEPQPQETAPSDPNKLTREEAERILQALQNEEEDLLRQVLKPQTRPRSVEKDW